MSGKVSDTSPNLWNKEIERTKSREIGDNSPRKKWKLISDFLNSRELQLDKILTTNGKVILEAGCGTGNFIFHLAKQGYVTQVVGVDFAPSAISIARSRAIHEGKDGKSHFLLGDARFLPFKDEAFDAVFSLGVVEHFMNPYCLVNEMRRVLKVGGILLVTTPNKYGFHAEEFRLAGEKTYGRQDLYSPEELEQITQESGLEVMESYTQDFGGYFVRWCNSHVKFSIAKRVIYLIGIFLKIFDPLTNKKGFIAGVLSKKVQG